MSSTGVGKQRQGSGAGAVWRRATPGAKGGDAFEDAGGGPGAGSVLRTQNLAKGPWRYKQSLRSGDSSLLQSLIPGKCILASCSGQNKNQQRNVS